MILYLYIQIKSADDIRFSSPVNSWLQSLKPDLTCAELDNHSENFLINQTVKLVLGASKVILHLDMSDGQSIAAIRMIFEALRKAQKPTLALAEGSHKQLESMFKMIKLTPNKISSDKEAEALIANFLNP